MLLRKNKNPLVLLTDQMCGEPEMPDNSDVATDGLHYVGDTWNVTCHTGHVLIGSDYRKCQGSGEWSGEEPHCARKKTYNFITYVIFTTNY